ncbi:tape measure protein [Azospirillum agricola]|uniref:tape measure protein n=1 Tax=Azospirillum agricola TaxID=1720247 RepID=UPI000A0F1BE0|nr:tape measure protein [Azospirillum agricola]SMH29759.1 tape measure domain-containing protein [Azospirillum lipoferum]
MAELEGLYVTLGADASGLDRGMRSAEQSVNRAERAVSTSLGRMDQAMSRLDRSVAVVAQRLGQFAAVAGIAGVGALAAKTVDYAEAWTQVGNRLRLVAGDAAELKETQGQLFQASQKAGVAMVSVVDVYSRAAQSAGELGASQQQLTRFAGGVAQALAVSGTSADAAAGAMQQLGQLLGSARVQAEEYNSVLDGAPRIAKAVADGLTEAGGSVSRLKQLINDGKVSNKQFFDAFLGQIPKIQAEFETAVPTIGRALTTLDNAMGKLIGEANEAAGATTALARGLTTLGNNLDSVVSVATQVALALGGIAVVRMVPSGMAALTRAIDDQKVALYAKAVATAEAANAEQLAAAQTLISTQRAQATTAATLRAAEAEYAAKAAMAGTTASNIAVAEASLLQAKAKTQLTTNIYVLNRALAAERDAEAAVIMAREASIVADTEKIASLARLRAAQLAAAASGEAVAVADAHLTAASAGAQAASVALAQRASLLSVAWGAAKSVGAGLLALVGGPWNAAMLIGGAAVYYLATRTSEAEKAQERYNRVVSEGRQRVQEMTSATREQANALLEKQRNEVAAAQAAADAAAARVATLQSLVAEAREDSNSGGTAGLFASLFGTGGDGGVARLEAQLAAARKEVAATAAALDGLQSVGQKTGDAVGLELANKLSRGSSAFNTLNIAVGDAMKQAGLLVQSGRLMTNEQAQTEKSVTALGQALQAGAGFLRTYGTNADQVAGIMAALKLKIDPVASAVADMNREIAQLGSAEGAARTALTMLQSVNKARAEKGEPLLTTVSPEYLQMLDKARELETARVQAATDARAKVLDLDTRITRAQAAGNATLAAELTRQKAVEELVARGVDRKVAEKNAAQDYAVAIAGAGAAAGQAAKEILLAADAQMVMAQAAGLGEAATRAATQATKLAQEAAKAGGNVAAVQAANLREEAAALVAIRNETVRGLELETANTNALTLAMAAGGEAVRIAQEEEYKLTLTRKLGADATVAGTKAQQALNDALDAYRKNRAANDNNRLEQARQSANDNLALAERELELMGQAEPVRERALTTLRNQQEAARKVAELGEDGARQWLEWQEQIADKRAMIDYLKSVQATAKEISGDISEALYDRLMDPSKATSVVDVFRSIFKRIAVAALETQVVLPIVTQVVGAAPGLFGLSTPSGGSVGSGAQASGGGLLGTATNAASLARNGWSIFNGGAGLAATQTAGSFATSGFGSALGLSQSAVGVIPEAVVAGDMMLTGAGNSFVGAAGTIGAAAPYGMIGGFGGSLISNQFFGGSKIAGAASGAALGAGSAFAAEAILGAGAAGGPWGIAAAAVIAAVMAALGSQKPSVGPNAQGNVVYQDGRYVQGPSAADNGGDPSNVKTVTGAVAQGFNALADTYGLTLKAQNYGYWEGGTDKATGNGVHNDPKELVRQILADATASDPNSAVAKALANSTVRASGDLEEIQKYLDVAAKIDNATAAFASLSTTLDQVRASAKAAAADGFKAVDDEIKTADTIGLGAGYRDSLEDSIRSTFEGAAQSWTPLETAMAQLNGQTDAWIEAVARWNVGISEAEIRADAAAKAEKLRAQAVAEYTASLYDAQGRSYLTNLSTINSSRDTVRRNLAAVGVGDAAGKADTLVTAQLTSALSGLNLGQLADVTRTLGGEIGTLAENMRQAGQAAATADLTVRALRALGEGGAADSYAQALADQRDVAQAVTDGMSDAYIAGLQWVQGIEAVTRATERAAQADNARADIFTRAVSASGNSVWAATLRFDQDAARQRQDAWNNGLRGQDLTNLDTVLAAERAQTILDTAKQAYTAEVDRQIQAINDNTQSARDVVSATGQFVKSVRDALQDRLLNDSISPLSARERLEEARRQVEDVYAKAVGGDEDARSRIIGLLNSRDEIARGFFESTDNTDFWDSQRKLEALGLTAGEQLDSAEQTVKIADAQLKELQAARTAAQNLGQKQLFSLDQLHATMIEANDNNLKALTGLSSIIAPTQPVAPDKGGTTATQQAAEWMRQWFAQYDVLVAQNNAGQLSAAELNARGSALLQSKVDYANALSLDPALWNAVIGAASAGSDQGKTAAWLRQVAHDKGVPTFALGGIIPHIPGVSIPGVDSVPLIGMPGEGVVNLRGMGVLGADGLAALNAGRWPANDRWSGNVTALRASGGGSTASLEQRFDRAVAILERIASAIESGDADNVAATGEVAAAITTLARQTGRAADPVGSRRRTVNG